MMDTLIHVQTTPYQVQSHGLMLPTPWQYPPLHLTPGSSQMNFLIPQNQTLEREFCKKFDGDLTIFDS